MRGCARDTWARPARRVAQAGRRRLSVFEESTPDTVPFSRARRSLAAALEGAGKLMCDDSRKVRTEARGLIAAMLALVAAPADEVGEPADGLDVTRTRRRAALTASASHAGARAEGPFPQEIKTR